MAAQVDTLGVVAAAAGTETRGVFRVALDWTPNTNHTGFYVAAAKGWYAEAGLTVDIKSADEDDYATTPARKVLAGEADFAVAPSESAIAYSLGKEEGEEGRLVSVAALLQEDTSAVVVLGSSARTRPRDLDGCVYASYNARYEGAIVQELIRSDGGAGTFTESTPNKLGIFETLTTGGADATWVFMGWEGVEASRKGVPLRAFPLADAGIPYGYTPVLLASPALLSSRGAEVKAFLAATARGYEWAAAHPDESADVLCARSGHPTLCDGEFVRASQRVVGTHYLHPSSCKWGVQEEGRWADFLAWLQGKGILTDKAGVQVPPAVVAAAPRTLYTSAYLP